MEFRNHTPFPALAFVGIDQRNRAFHVIALRQTLSFATGKLEYADQQAPLCEVDEFFGEMNASSVRQESDLCQYKPKCDVIVNGTAYAPRSRVTTQFDVRLQVYRPGAPLSLPEPPQGLNYRMAPSQVDLEKWQREVAKIKSMPAPSISLIDKTLNVCGERYFFKAGMILHGWELTSPKILKSLPLRYEYAFGGQCRVNLEDPAARKLPEALWISAEQRARHPEKDNPPVTHTVYEPNHVGRGYAQEWYLFATKCTSVPGPQITYPDAPVSAKLFEQVAHGNPEAADALSAAGYGIRAKVHPERRKFVGTIDEAFIKGKEWLPKDFDFAVWNAAPPDQQIEHMTGDEIITLTNLCPHDAPGATVDSKGNAVLTLALPRHECFVLVRMESGEMMQHPLSIDTVIIEPDDANLTLVWRAALPKTREAPIRVCEARMHTHEDRDRLKVEMARIKSILDQAKRTGQTRQSSQRAAARSEAA